jgi:hypothetical protein
MDAITPTGESRLKIAVDRCKNISWFNIWKLTRC